MQDETQGPSAPHSQQPQKVLRRKLGFVVGCGWTVPGYASLINDHSITISLYGDVIELRYKVVINDEAILNLFVFLQL